MSSKCRHIQNKSRIAFVSVGLARLQLQAESSVIFLVPIQIEKVLGQKIYCSRFIVFLDDFVVIYYSEDEAER